MERNNSLCRGNTPPRIGCQITSERGRRMWSGLFSSRRCSLSKQGRRSCKNVNEDSIRTRIHRSVVFVLFKAKQTHLAIVYFSSRRRNDLFNDDDDDTLPTVMDSSEKHSENDVRTMTQRENCEVVLVSFSYNRSVQNVFIGENHVYIAPEQSWKVPDALGDLNIEWSKINSVSVGFPTQPRSSTITACKWF